MTTIERTILVNQFEILSRLDPDNQEAYAERAEILRSGYEGFFDKALISEDTVSPQLCYETREILAMFQNVEHTLENQPGPLPEEMSKDLLMFQGFDANTGDHYYVAQFLINKPGHWERFKDRELNSHSPAELWRYRRMLPVYRVLIDTVQGGWTVEHLKQLETAAKGEALGA
jgi:uncharacterized protein YfbU (UPF0304 family)